MGRKVGVWRRVKSKQMQGGGGRRCEGVEKAGTWGRWSQRLGEGRIGREGSERGKVG